MRKTNIGELVFFWILFSGVGFLAYSIMSPYLTALFLAMVFGVLFLPFYKRMKRIFPQSESLASLITVTIVLFVILVPVIFIGVILFKEVANILNGFTGTSPYLAVINEWTKGIESYVGGFVPGFHIQFEMEATLRATLSWISNNLNGFFSGIVAFFLDMFLIVIALFFFFRDGQKLREFAIKWSPLADVYDEGILTKLGLAVTSVVRGTLVTAVVQGFLVSIGFFMFGVSNPVLWGLVATISALLPMVGTSIITFPAAFLLIATGHLLPGIGMILWAVLIVGLIDNALRPMLMNRTMHIHSFLILLSVFGGLVYFGPIGFLAGPIILAFFFVLLEIYPEIVGGKVVE